MFFKNKDIPTIEIAKMAVSQMKTDNSRLRRASMKKRLDYYFGKQSTYLDEVLAKQFKQPERLKLQKEFLNITEMIINEVGVLYSERPKRELIDTEDEKSKEIYSEIIEDSKIDSIMQVANRLAKLCKTVLVRPVWRDDCIEYDIYTPNMFEVIQDTENPTKPLAIVYSNQIDIVRSKPINNDDLTTALDPFSLPNNIFYVWTKDNHFAFTYGMNKSSEVIINLIKNANNADNINPYGCLPFVTIYDGVPIDNFFVEGGDDLIACNEINNVKLTEKNHLTKMQSFSILVRKGADSTKDEVILDPSMIIDIPADDDVRKGVDLKFISPESKIAELETDIQSRLNRIAVKFKLNPDMFVASGQRSSADSLQMQAYYLGKVIKADKPAYADFECELFELTRKVFNYHSDIKIAEDANLFIDYKDTEVPKTQDQEDAHNLIMFQNGIMSKSDWLMEENPDIRSKEQAEEKLIEINEEKKQNMDAMVQTGVMNSALLPKKDNSTSNMPNIPQIKMPESLRMQGVGDGLPSIDNTASE